jgi:hypothetical protein
VVDFVDFAIEEEWRHATELLYGICDVEAEGWRTVGSSRVEMCACGLGGGFGGVHDGDVGRGDAAQKRLDQRVMRASENEDVGFSCRAPHCFGQIDSGDLLGDRVLDPSFFDEGDEQRAGFFESCEASAGESALVGMTADGRFGAEDDCLASPAEGCGGVSAGLNHSDDGHADCTANVEKRERGCSVASDNEHVDASLLEELRGPDSVAGDGLARLGTVREASGVSEIEIVGVGDEVGERAENGEASDTGVEHGDARARVGGRGQAVFIIEDGARVMTYDLGLPIYFLCAGDDWRLHPWC